MLFPVLFSEVNKKARKGGSINMNKCCYYDFYYIKMQNFQRLIWKADTIVYKITYAIIKLEAKPFNASAPIFEKNSHCIVNWWLIVIHYNNFIHPDKKTSRNLLETST